MIDLMTDSRTLTLSPVCLPAVACVYVYGSLSVLCRAKMLSVRVSSSKIAFEVILRYIIIIILINTS